MTIMTRILVALLCATLLSACGFKLRGQAELPYKSIYIALPESNPFRVKLVRALTYGSKTTVAPSAKEAQATFGVTGDATIKDILSLSPAGFILEYQLVRTFSFRVYDANGRDLIPPGKIVLTRDITYDQTEVLSKQQEEVLLMKDMDDDLVQQIIRRLAVSKPEFAPAKAEEQKG